MKPIDEQLVDCEVRATSAPSLDLGRRYRLSRFLQLYPEAGGLVAESLITGCRQVLPNAAAVRLLLSLTRSVSMANLLEHLPEAQRAAASRFFALCLKSGLIVDAEGGADEDRLISLLHWERHDLTFHLRSRRGRNPFPVGATNHLAPMLPSEPARRVPGGVAMGCGGPTAELLSIPLARPDMSFLETGDSTLTQVLEARRSRYSLEPVTVEALGALLYRTCRVTAIIEDPKGEDLLRRVYPSGGSLHSLEVYVVAHRCIGLPSGGYRYDPFEHRLVPCEIPEEARIELLREAQVGTGRLRDLPSILLIVSSRFRRVSRKYQSIAYHLILQEVGALYQTLYLVAETLGMAACAIGAGDSERFAQAFGTDFFAESSVGEMILGGRQESDR